MKTQAAVKALHTDLKRMNTAKTNETKALAAIATQEQKVIDQFVAAPSLASFGSAMSQMFSLGQKQVTTKDHYDAAIRKDRQAALKVLKPAEAGLSLHQLNTDRHQLGLHALAHKPVSNTNTEPWKKGPGHLYGADTSHYQNFATFKQSIAGKQFSAIKATEGTTYTDPSFRERWNLMGQRIKQGKQTLRIAYHYMRPGNGVAQAKHFLGALGIKGKLQAGTRLALDFEGSALSSPRTLHDAATYIHKVTGLWPLVYASASRISEVKAAVPHAPLWEAKWGGSRPNNVPFLQYADGPGFDHDVFNGSEKALKRFAGFPV